MSAMDVISRRTLGHPSRFSGLVGNITERVQRYKTYRRTLEELEALSDRELIDLGISRTQMRGIAYRAAYDG